MGVRNLKNCLLVILLIVILCNFCLGEKFGVRPGGQTHSVEEKSEDVTCKFTYVCQGGTIEDWIISVSEDQRGHYCDIARDGSASYLFFQEFHVDITGAKITDAEVYKNGGIQVAREQFKIDSNKLKVSHSGSFNNELSGIRVYLASGKEEL